MVSITQDVFWVGAIDWTLRNFHGYATPTGSTYNAYVIIDDAPTLIDTVKHSCVEEMIERIREVIDPAKIRYIISNHTEMDHSGSIDALLTCCPNAEIVCSPKGEEGLRRHFKKDWKFKVVNTGDTLCIGKRTLHFVLIPMVHWPDSMVTYSPTDEILFSNDAFGQHYASPERFVDEVGAEVIYPHAAKYYANIVLPYGNQVLSALEALTSLAISQICPSHGLIWRQKDDIAGIVARYGKWARHETEQRVVIVYDTMWHSTQMMAERLYHFLDRRGISAVRMDLQQSHISDVVTEILSSRVVLFGSPILNNRMLPTMAALIMYVKGLKPKNRFAGVFGSYGWSTVGFKELETSVVDAGFTLLAEGSYVKFIPDESDLSRLDVLAVAVEEKVR